MPSKTFTGGRIRRADYDPASRELELRLEGGKVLAYRHVPQEVFQRLCSAPNPATYWEDRIAEEYPKGTPRATPAAGGKTLADLFGGGGDGDGNGDAACGDGACGGGDGGGGGD